MRLRCSKERLRVQSSDYQVCELTTYLYILKLTFIFNNFELKVLCEKALKRIIITHVVATDFFYLQTDGPKINVGPFHFSEIVTK